MNVRRGGLGRGLGALIPTGPETGGSAAGPAAAAGGTGNGDGPSIAAVAGARFAEVDVEAIRPNPRQPRTNFDEDSLDELVASLREVGMLQPIVVRPADDGGFEVVMGERRWRAARQAGLLVVPAIIRETPDDALLLDALLENLHRQQLNPLEEAAAYQQLLEEFGATHEELATRIGRSRSQVTNTLRLLGLPPTVQRRLAAGVLSAGHARALLAVTDPAEQERLADRVVAEGLSVRAVEEAVAVGDGRSRPRGGRTRRPPTPGLLGLADRLGDRLDTRVRVELGRSKGRITIEFASLEDLARIVATMAPDLADGLTVTESVPTAPAGPTTPTDPVEPATPTGPAGPAEFAGASSLAADG